MDWLYLALLSGFLLGVYDLFKKHSVSANAFMPVLLVSNLSAAMIWAPLVTISHFYPKDALH